MVLEKTLHSPLNCMEIKPVHLKDISPEYSLEGLMQKLKLQYFEPLMQRPDSLEKTLMLERLKAGGEGDNSMRGLDGIMDSMDMTLTNSVSSPQGESGLLESMVSQNIGHH